MIVVEGVDNSGKSTLIRTLLSTVLEGWPCQVSEGPPKYPGEQNVRVTRYLAYGDRYIFDRHPCVSQPIYGEMRTHTDLIDPDLLKRFYERKPLFIYCDPGDGRGLKGHVERATVDSAEHLHSVSMNYHLLLTLYRSWALQHAHVIYRIGDDVEFIKRVVKPEERYVEGAIQRRW